MSYIVKSHFSCYLFPKLAGVSGTAEKAPNSDLGSSAGWVLIAGFLRLADNTVSRFPL